MKGARRELQAQFNDFISKSILHSKECSKIINTIYKKYKVPMSLVADIFSLKTELQDQSDFIIFCVLRELNNSNEFKGYNLPLIEEWFTKEECKAYSKTKYRVDKIKFPIILNVIEISSNQWIGKITVQELMRFKSAGLIRYNEKTQRPLRKIINNEKEIYRIYLNRSQIESIKKSFKKETYIPNTITLNMPEDAEFSYSDGQLKIKELPFFDILDGYHRYIAMSNIYGLDKDFNYPMELRITCFNETKSQQFIWQEDQKTQMKKVDSESFNQDAPANRVVSELNEKPSLRGLITRNNSIIDASYLSQLIKLLYFKDKKTVTNKQIIEVRNSISNYFDVMIDKNVDMLDNKWDNLYLTAFMYCCSVGDYKNTNKLYKELKKKKNKNVINTNIMLNKNNILRIKKIYNEEVK